MTLYWGIGILIVRVGNMKVKTAKRALAEGALAGKALTETTIIGVLRCRSGSYELGR